MTKQDHCCKDCCSNKEHDHTKENFKCDDVYSE